MEAADNSPIRGIGMRCAEFLAGVGAWGIRACGILGDSGVFFVRSVLPSFTGRCRLRRIIERLRFFGARSLPVVLLTGAFAGMVLGLQAYYSLNQFGALAMIGPAVTLSLTRELGPVLTALMVIARAGSALSAEVGTMRITEQIDALEVMGIDTHAYLLAPNIVACLIAFPLLTGCFDLIGVFGGQLVAVNLLGVSPGTFSGLIQDYVKLSDIGQGLLKSMVFGLGSVWICLYSGYNASRGARGVSRATTRAVVLSAILVFVSDYIMTSVMW